MGQGRWIRNLPGVLAAAAGAGALLAVVSGALPFAILLLLCCLGALTLRRSWINSEQEYQRARAAMHDAERREHRSIRTERLLAKHGSDVAVVARIERKELWVGETADQLRDALGEPEGVDVRPLKTRSREVWKYGRTGRNRYSTRITLDNGTVVRWEKRERPATARSHHETNP
jgi:hypothetical protein